MANYQSAYTGAQIDAAIGAASTAAGNGGIVSVNSAYGGRKIPTTSATYYVAGSTGTAENTDPLKFDTHITVQNSVLSGACWNDYAEYRQTLEDAKPGQVVKDNDDGSLSITTQRLVPGAQVISDTYGFIIGENKQNKTPLAVSGRVLVYPYRSRFDYHAGQAVCSAPNGTVDIMTREEIMKYPDAIIGIVSEIPAYPTWGVRNVRVDGRIWIKVR